MRTWIHLLGRLLSLICSLALVAAGTILTVEVVAALVGTGPALLPDDTASRLAGWTWRDGVIVAVIASVGALGLLFCLVGLALRPALTVAVRERPGVTWDRRALERSLARRLGDLDGVAKARLRIDRNRLTAKVTTHRRDPGDALATSATVVLRDALDVHGLDLRPTVRVRRTSRR